MVETDVAGLAVAVETAIALFQAHGVPGDVVMQQLAAALVQVQALTGGVCGEENAHTGVGIVKTFFDFVAGLNVQTTIEALEWFLIRAGIAFLRHFLDVVQGGFVLREDHQPFVCPLVAISVFCRSVPRAVPGGCRRGVG